MDFMLSTGIILLVGAGLGFIIGIFYENRRLYKDQKPRLAHIIEMVKNQERARIEQELGYKIEK